ncbi:hypothetical protein CYLTODRAFT_366911 [Cylindrobasidium torrendii FP15055 ss-10]|uniref:Zn(2)-C6 fungal-type domain-containing protein n=1 Tax=Cylindrobasidium torrendii FP15055 ss-10 TaxID=1314674 RepID=A0A0D7BQG8_9AGAR|nr:hypothetical protein CYLTODRAFT_366911 [Cylindrobasidium torrendii FP15055 ss-10]
MDNGNGTNSSDGSPEPVLAGSDATSAKASEKRVALACHRCRVKRARCSGEKPVCLSCQKANEECTWPTGRKRKRTRREMEEAERKDRDKKAGELLSGVFNGCAPSTDPIWDVPRQHIAPNPVTPVSPSAAGNLWNFPLPAQSSTYTWPSPGSSSSQTQEPSPDDFLMHLPGQEKQAANLVQAMESQAFINTDPLKPDGLELYYYRFSGSTAIRPGINRISLKLQPRVVRPATAPVPASAFKPNSPEPVEVMFDDTGIPLPHVYLPLFETFFSTMSSFFPSIHRSRMDERLKTHTMSAFLLNCICAVSARFHPTGHESPAQSCAPFVTKAQELIIPLLHLPTHDVCTGLLLLAWANFGQSSESGLWQFSGMAIRMALDLGIHENSEIYESPAHATRTNQLFWSIFITDRILSFVTGRPPSIPEEMIEIPLPSNEDWIPHPTGQAYQPGEVPFAYWARLMVLCGRIASLLNGRRGRVRTLVTAAFDTGAGLSSLQKQLVTFYAELPSSMKWSIENFRTQEAKGSGGTYLALHLWANAVLALVYHPELLASPSGAQTPLSQNMDRSPKLSLSSSRTISECLVLADLFSQQSYLSNPFVVHPIFVACLAFVHDIKMTAMGMPVEDLDSKSSGHTANLVLTSLAKQNLDALMKAIHHMEHYWSGIGYVSRILDEKAAGSGYMRNGHASLKSLKTFISLPDKGVLRRFITSDPNTAPATETSLRSFIAKTAAENNSAYSLDELFNMYSVEGFHVQPADTFELQSLLGSSSDYATGASDRLTGPGTV